jgi:hypothetical protein
MKDIDALNVLHRDLKLANILVNFKQIDINQQVISEF